MFLVREKEDLDNDDGAFNPDLTHQIFGQRYYFLINVILPF